MSNAINVVPVFDPDRGWRTWNITEIYTGSGSGCYVPNVNDAVWDWQQGLFRVISVDITTGLSTLRKYVSPKDPGIVTDEDVLLGAGPGTLSESYRLYCDDSVVPSTIACDSRLHIYGSTASYIKIFLGSDIGENGTVISMQYDQSGTLLGENVPLELVAMPDVDNRAIKTPMVSYTTRALRDGEVCTAVVYGDDGNVLSINRLLVKKTAYIRQTDNSKLYITSIHLECPFLSGSDSRVIEYPINVTLESLPMMGVVTYSNGSVRHIPVDGGKFSLFGIDNYVATILGQKVPLVLDYKLSADEINYIASSGYSHHIAEAYQAVSIKADGAYSVKLFVYPVWVNETVGYRLEYFLYNLDREQMYYATPYVESAQNSIFYPVLYGTAQNITVAINLSKVNGAFANYRHVQTYQIVLFAPGNEKRDNWSISYTPGADPKYGAGLKADATFVNVNFWKVKLDSGCASKEEWLRRSFYATQPLFNPDLEVEAPEPNFFRLVAGNHKVECAISQWDSEFVIPSGQVFEGQPIYVEFFKRLSSTDLELGIGGFVFHQTP